MSKELESLQHSLNEVFDKRMDVNNLNFNIARGIALILKRQECPHSLYIWKIESGVTTKRHFICSRCSLVITEFDK